MVGVNPQSHFFLDQVGQVVEQFLVVTPLSDQPGGFLRQLGQLHLERVVESVLLVNVVDQVDHDREGLQCQSVGQQVA